MGMILLDTSVLVAALCGDSRLAPDLRALIEEREVLAFSALVLYEFLRGPRTGRELAGLWDIFAPEAVLPFLAQDAALAASLYRRLPRARSRAADIAIAACALSRDARFWTLNTGDFSDISELRLLLP